MLVIAGLQYLIRYHLHISRGIVSAFLPISQRSVVLVLLLKFRSSAVTAQNYRNGGQSIHHYKVWTSSTPCIGYTVSLLCNLYYNSALSQCFPLSPVSFKLQPLSIDLREMWATQIHHTWTIPIKIGIVIEVAHDDVVRVSENYSSSVVHSFGSAALELVDQGAGSIITSCGFLAAVHNELQSRIPVPLGTSSLWLRN